jgi:ribonuclease P protein component
MDADESRFGVVVSKKFSPLAVKRNSFKRTVYNEIAHVLDGLTVKPVGSFVFSPNKGVTSSTNPKAIIADIGSFFAQFSKN